MPISWRQDFNPNTLLSELRKISTTGLDGKTSVTDTVLPAQIAAVFRSGVDFGEHDIPEVEQYRMVNKAIFGAARLSQLTPSGIKAEISRLATEFVSFPLRKFTLLTNLLAKNSYDLRVVRISKHTITFSKERPVGFDWPEEKCG